MCGAPSRRGSDDSYQELAPSNQRPDGLRQAADAPDADTNDGLTIDLSDQNAMYIKMVGPPIRLPARDEPLTRRLSSGERALVDVATGPGRHTGRFLTMHKRRRKKLATRCLGQDHTALLDDVSHGQVQCILDQCGLWAFNAFALETAAGGRCLSVLCFHLFHWYGLIEHFQLETVRVWKLFTLIEEGYHSTNPYHNSIHAADVTQAMHCFLQEEKIRRHMDPIEVMASLLGAVTHDLDHPGVNQPFLIATSNHLAALYENMSVLENHHWRSAVGCLLESGVAEQLTPYRDDLESQIRSLILATDITRQQEFIGKLKTGIDTDTLDMSRADDRHFILQIALKCADISNPTRPWDVSKKWSLKVCEEFFRQGDYERKLDLPVTSLCDRYSTSVPKIQSGFFRFVVTPLFSEWHRFLSSPLSRSMMRFLHGNHQKWEALEAADAVDETRTEISDAGDDDAASNVVVVDVAEPTDGSDRGSSEALIPADFIPSRRQSSVTVNRRHSVPVNMARPPIVTRSTARRESLPPPPVHASPLGGSPRRRTPNPHIIEDDELLLFGSQLSLMSSGSGGATGGSGIHYSSSSAADREERPLSAETLLPEPSITSMTGFPSGPKCLTRQQTFPPLQPYVRTRYMSTTAEMSTCRETLLEGESHSNSSQGSEENVSAAMPAIAVLSPNNSTRCAAPHEMFIAELQYRPPQAGGPTAQAGSKRPDVGQEKAPAKMAKLSEGASVRCGGGERQKENVDPSRRNLLNGLARRRGSAPVTSVLARPDDSVQPTNIVLRTEVGFSRRGSMPAEFVHQRETDENRHADTGRPPHGSQFEPSRQQQQHPRRGSVPADILTSDVRRVDVLTRHSASLNGKSAGGRRKKQLRRRSSGGPETVCLVSAAEVAEGSVPPAWNHRWRRDIVVRRSDMTPDAILSKRRGSLPIEVLTVGHTDCRSADSELKMA